MTPAQAALQFPAAWCDLSRQFDEVRDTDDGPEVKPLVVRVVMERGLPTLECEAWTDLVLEGSDATGTHMLFRSAISASEVKPSETLH